MNEAPKHLIGNFSDYRDYLRVELEERLARNSHYSLRSFAKQLAVQPQNLSGILKKKRGLSVDGAARVAERLNLSPRESAYFVDLVSLVHARGETARKVARFRLAQYQVEAPYCLLQADVFKAISDFYHYALLELTATPDFRDDPAWIAQRLGISKLQAEQAVARLLRLEVLEKQAGQLRKRHASLTTTHDVPSAAIRHFTAQILAKASEALEAQDVHERDITTITMAIDPARLPEAKSMIRSFRRRLTAFLEQGERREVYVFVPALFRLTKKEN